MLPLADVLGVFTPRNHLVTSKNDIVDVPGYPHIPEDARNQNMRRPDFGNLPLIFFLHKQA